MHIKKYVINTAQYIYPINDNEVAIDIRSIDMVDARRNLIGVAEQEPLLLNRDKRRVTYALHNF